MIEMHTRIFCQCGKRFFHLYASDTPLPGALDITVECPFCGYENHARYEFSSPNLYYRYSLDQFIGQYDCSDWMHHYNIHAIYNHFSYNTGNTNEEQYPRKCTCGQEILLKQRRVI